jgi:hypothetical protein
MVGAAGLSLLMAALPAAAEDGTHRGEYLGTRSSDSSETQSIGTQPEEYGNPPATKKVEKSAKPAPKAKVLGTPGTAASVKASQPPPKMPPPLKRDKDGRPIINMERSPSGVGPYDTVHNVRIDKNTPHPESADSEKKKAKKPAR